MSAIHTLYKQLSHIWLTITLMCTALFGMGSLVQASNEVMVSLSAIYDIMPPEASVYKETPEKYFVVNINNPQDHTLTIYLTMKLEKLTGEKFIMEQKVSAKPTSPMFAITLPASTSITLTSTQLHNHFRHLGLSHAIVEKAFRNVLHSSVQREIMKCRIEEAEHLLKTTQLSVVRIAGLAGFASAQYFCRCFSAATGLSPQVYREKSCSKN